MPFYWLAATAGTTKFTQAAMLIEPGSGGWERGRLLQLDLAASGTMPRGFPARGESASGGGSGRVTGLLAEATDLRALRGSVTADLATREVGTMGLPLFDRQTIFVDFAQFRFAALPTRSGQSSIPSDPGPTGVVDYDGDRVFLGIGTPSQSQSRALLDTGLIPFEVWTTRAHWREWTGMTPGSPGVRRYLIATTGDTLVFAAAKARRPFVVAGRRLEGREVVYLESGPSDAALEEWPFEVETILGASFFAGTGLLVLDLQNRRFFVQLATQGR